MTTANSATQTQSKSEPSSPRGIELKQIMVPVDFSDAAGDALAFAIDLAVKFDSQLTLLHVLELSHYSRYIAVYPDFALQPLDLAELETRTRSEAEARMAPLTRQIESRGVRVRPLIRVGFSAPEIIRTAEEENADCIVISTHGYSGLSHFLLGSTTERVIRHAPCPVMVVRIKDGRAAAS